MISLSPTLHASLQPELTCAYQGARNIRFSGNFALFSCNTRFKICPFALLPANHPKTTRRLARIQETRRNIDIQMWIEKANPSVKERSLVVSDLRPETKGSRFESSCKLCVQIELSAVTSRLVFKCQWSGWMSFPFPMQSCDSWMFVKENPDRKKVEFLVLTL